MKGSIIALLAATALAPQVWASKARVTALQNSPTINDERDLLKNPARATEHGSFFVIEAGSNKEDDLLADGTLTYGTYTDPKAEGGFSRDLNGDARLGAHIGRYYDVTAERRTFNAGFLGVKNPIDLHYARKSDAGSWGVGLTYAKSDEKALGKQDLLGLNLGYATSMFDIALNTYLTNSAESATLGKVTGSTPINIYGRYIMDNLFITGEIETSTYKYQDSAATAISNQKASNIRVGLFHRQELEAGQFFYGGKLNMEDSDDTETVADDKSTEKFLSFLAGLEANATSWLDLRGSISQEVLYGTQKAGAGDETTRANSTVAAAGASLKFGKLEVDATLGAAFDSTNYGKVNGNSLLGDLAMTYSF